MNRSPLKLSLLLLLVVILTSCAPARTAADADRYARAARGAAIVVTHRHGEHGDFWFGCSGVLIDHERVLTGRHCIRPRIDGTPALCMFAPGESLSRQLLPPEAEAAAATGKSNCTVAAEYADIDIAVLHIEERVPDFVRAVAFASEAPAIGAPVHGVLHPNLVVNTWFTGYVNSRLSAVNLGGYGPEFAPKELFGYASPVASGASGGMVLDDNGLLLGITLAVEFGTNTGLAIPISSIRERLAHGG